MNDNVPIKKNRRQAWIMTLLILVGLVLVNIAVFFSPEISNRRLLKYVWYYCDHHHWPDWYATLLWIVAVGTAFYTLVQFSWMQAGIQKTTPRFISQNRRQHPRKYAAYIVFGTIIVFAVTSFFIWYPPGDLMKLFKKVLYYGIYQQFGYAPFADLMEGGVITWRLFVIPTAGLTVVVLLLRFRRKRGKKHEE